MTRLGSKEFTWVEGAAFLCGAIATQLSSEMIAQWSAYFYSPTEGGVRTIYVSLQLIGVAVVVGRVWDAFTDPLIGVWSDVTRRIPGRFRFPRIAGRRRPFIFWGSVGLCATGTLFWFPPVESTSPINFYYVSVIVCLHWLFFTVCNIPLLALGPEVARSQEARIKLGVWVAVGMILGLAIAVIVPPILFSALSSNSNGAAGPTGYQRTGIIFAIASLLLFQMPVWLVNERYTNGAGPSPLDQGIRGRLAAVYSEMRDALTNRPFLIYITAIFFSSVGVLGVQRVLPNWAEVALGGNEETVAILMAPYILTALLTALAMYLSLPLINRYLSVKSLFLSTFAITVFTLPAMYLISVSSAGPGTRVMMGACIFAAGGIGQGITYVLTTAIIGEIIDLDSQRHGQRREAVFNGIFGIAVKLGQAVALFVSTQIMFFFGNSVENPMGILLMGPVAGVCAILAFAAFSFYPRLHVTKRGED